MTRVTETGKPATLAPSGAGVVRSAPARAAARPERMRRRHGLFLAALVLAAALRLVAMLGYTPALWFSDSLDYVHTAMKPYPNPVRPSGYSFMLAALRPFHSFALVIGLQHLMGLAVGVMIYALLRRRFGLPAWGATLAALPALFDAYQIQVEHLVLSDVPFTFLMIAAVTLLLWSDRLTWKMAAGAGLLLSLATLTRTVGLAVCLAAAGYLLVRRAGLRPVAALVGACALPLTLYGAWFYSWHGQVALTRSDGMFLYVRAMSFADCGKIKPPVEELPLCTNTPADRRPASQQYLWARLSPLHRVPDGRFSVEQNRLAGDFARRAIVAQPGDYLRHVAEDFFRTFQWNRTVFPDRATFERYEFGTRIEDMGAGRADGGVNGKRDAAVYERSQPRTRIVEPFAGVVRGYQDVVYLRGSMLGVILLVGLAGLLVRRRPPRREAGPEKPGRKAGRRARPALLPWVTAAGLLLAPAATVEFDYRYVLPAMPLACLAAALPFSGRAFGTRALTTRAAAEAGTPAPDRRTGSPPAPSATAPTEPRTP